MKYPILFALLILIVGPQHSMAQRKTIMPDKTTFDFETGKFLFEAFHSEKAFRNKTPYESSQNENALLSDNDNMEGILKRILKKENLTDTSGSIFPDAKSSLKLDMSVTSLVTNLIQTSNYYYRLNIAYTFQLKLKSHYGKPLVTEIFEDDIDFTIGYFETGNTADVFAESFEEAVTEKLLEFLKLSSVEPYLLEDKILDPPYELSSDSLTIQSQDVHQIQDWHKALVTVMDSLGHGSGAIVSSDGYIVSNYHVVATAEQLHVKLHNDRSFPATVVRYDPETDLALLKIDTTQLHTFELYPSTKNLIGEDVYIAGTPVDTLLSNTISFGIVSGKRGYHGVNYLQTDAVVNFGNSGGPMLTTDGRLAGIVNAKFGGFGIEGIGFAIPLEYLHDRLKLKQPLARAAQPSTPAKKSTKK